MILQIVGMLGKTPQIGTTVPLPLDVPTRILVGAIVAVSLSRFRQHTDAQNAHSKRLGRECSLRCLNLKTHHLKCTITAFIASGEFTLVLRSR